MMKTRRVSWGLVALAALAASSALLTQRPVSAAPGDQDILAALETVVDLTIEDESVVSLSKRLQEAIGATVLIDYRALEEVGLSASENTVSGSFRGMKLRNVMLHLLDGLDLTWILQDGALRITTQEAAEWRGWPVRVHGVSDLVQVVPGPQLDTNYCDYDTLTNLIVCCVAPETWDEVGGPGSIEPFRQTLVLRQAEENHRLVELLLAALRKTAEQASQSPRKAPKQTSLLLESLEHDAFYHRLGDVGSVDFVETPLSDVVKHIGKKAGVFAISDVRSLEDVGVGDDVPISFSCSGLPWGAILRNLLRDLELTWIVRGEALVVTTPEFAELNLETRVYPVGDLVYSDGEISTGDAAPPAPWLADYDTLINMITTSADPESWNDVGGPGEVVPFPLSDALVISQTSEVHERVEMLLMDVREKASPDEADLRAGASDDLSVTDENGTVLKMVVYHLPSAKERETIDDKNSSRRRSAPVDLDSVARSQGVGQFGGDFGSGVSGGVDWSSGIAIPEVELLETIQELLAPESWRSTPHVYARALPGRIVIRQTASIHRQIEWLLHGLSVPFYTSPPGPWGFPDFGSSGFHD